MLTSSAAEPSEPPKHQHVPKHARIHLAGEVSEVCSGDWRYYNMISNDLLQNTSLRHQSLICLLGSALGSLKFLAQVSV